MSQPDDAVPISSLFFNDAGPHVVRAGYPSRDSAALTPTPARGQELRALLNTSIAQLGAVSGETRRRTPPPMPAVVPIETLLYSGRAALDRALEVRSSIVASSGAPQSEMVQELLDLIVLATSE